MARTTDPRSMDPRSAQPTPRSPIPPTEPAGRSPQLPTMPHAQRVLSTLNTDAVPATPSPQPVPEFEVHPLRAKRAPRQRRSAAYRRAQFLRHTLDTWRRIQRQLPPVDAVQPSRGRVLSVFGVLLGAAIALEARLFWLQVVQHPELSQRARAQQQVRVKPFVPRRPIVDRNGTILALDRLTYTLYAHPKLFRIELNEAAQQLAPLLKRSPYEIRQKLGQGRSGLRIADDVPESVATEIRALGLDGLDLQPGTSRIYPQQDLFADIVGYVNVDLQGQAGVEYQMQDLLERSGDWITLGRTPTGMKLLDLTPNPSPPNPSPPNPSPPNPSVSDPNPAPDGSAGGATETAVSSPANADAANSDSVNSNGGASNPDRANPDSANSGSAIAHNSASRSPASPSGAAIAPNEAAPPPTTPAETKPAPAAQDAAGERSRDRSQRRSTLPYTDDLRLQLTFDTRIQRASRIALRQQMEAFKAKKGTVIVMDARTGGLLALASEPTYDPNRFYEADVARFKNWAVAELQEPGSTFKPVNVAIALESGAIRPEDTLNDTGAIRMGPDVIRNADFRQVGARGQIDLREIMRTSSNVGMVRMIQKMDPLIYHDWLQKLGIGSTSGTDLPFEVASQMRSRERFQQVPIEVATTAFGQGLSLTPLQLARLAATLANDGYLVVPHTIEGLVSADGQRYWKPYRPEPIRVFSQSTTRAVLEMMEAVVSDGTGKRAQIAQYRIAGKTGTSQKIGQDGRYSKALVTSFIGILTVDRPRYVVLAMFDEPQGGSGGLVAAPVVKEVMEAVIAIEQIPPAPSP